MDYKIKQLIEVKKKYPDVFKIINYNCPSAYGLNDYCDYCSGNCIECWEMAIEEVKDNAN